MLGNNIYKDKGDGARPVRKASVRPSLLSIISSNNALQDMRQFAVISLLALGFSLQAGAQSFLDGLKEKKTGQGTVTVTQDPAIDELVNNTKLLRTQPTAPKKETVGKPENNSRNTAANNEVTAKTPSVRTHTERKTDSYGGESGDLPAIDTSKKVMRGGRKITGYRVQAYSGGNSRADRQKAERIGNAIKSRFPDLPIYVHFYSPRWICRVGNFRTYQEANEVLQEIKDMGYRQACIVKGKITVAY